MSRPTSPLPRSSPQRCANTFTRLRRRMSTAADFRRLALSLPDAEESSHMGSPDFRVGGRIFATLASQKDGYGNLMLSPELQADFVGELPDVFIPIAGGWGRNGATHVRLAAANEDLLAGSLRAAWKLRLEKNKKSGTKTRSQTK